MGREIQTLERKASLAKIGTYEEVWLQAMKTRLDKLRRSVGYKNSYTRRLISWMNLRYDSPAKRSVYGGKPERARWERTVQGFDGALWRAAFAPEDELKFFVADPAEFVNKRKETALVFSYEIPFWIKTKYHDNDIKRGPRVRTGDKMMFRFTLVTMQAVLDYFDIDVDPNGLIMPTVLIVPGRHCRLEHISPYRTWT